MFALLWFLDVMTILGIPSVRHGYFTEALLYFVTPNLEYIRSIEIDLRKFGYQKRDLMRPYVWSRVTTKPARRRGQRTLTTKNASGACALTSKPVFSLTSCILLLRMRKVWKRLFFTQVLDHPCSLITADDYVSLNQRKEGTCIYGSFPISGQQTQQKPLITQGRAEAIVWPGVWLHLNRKSSLSWTFGVFSPLWILMDILCTFFLME